MPLCSNRLPNSVISTLREMPEDEGNLPTKCYPYQTQVSIYDSKCTGCQYMRIEAYTTSTWYDVDKVKVFKDIQLAINYASSYKCQLKRSCDYPGDILHKNGNLIYPTLMEIISNTCQFWNENLLIEQIDVELLDEGLSEF